jgi:hypothetical protein
MSPFIRVVRAHEEETVEIAWTCADGSRYVQRITIPPRATREAQAQPPLEFDPARNAAGQVLDRTQTNRAGQRFSTSEQPE